MFDALVNPLLWFVGLVVAPFLIAKADRWRKSATTALKARQQTQQQWWDKERMPEELRGARLFMNEEDIRAFEPVPLHGRVDQVFETRNGVLVPVDTKTRKYFRVYDSDIIQLSVYRLILEKMYGNRHTVSQHGYIRAVVLSEHGKENIRYLRVRLLSEGEIVELWQQYKALKTGKRKRSCSCAGALH